MLSNISNTPCVVTNVGDSAWLVGHTGNIVDPDSPMAIAHAITKIIDEKEIIYNNRFRDQVTNNFGICTLVETTNTTLKIYYANLDADNEEVIIKIYDDSDLIFQHTEWEDPNEFTLYFDYNTI